ncbi:mannose-1-phosphate guanylyltransferase [Terrabacter sp. GCM10028922]|uniref:mannose-1-phosphate guanylyltransferase n=1 Tax=Terrabacter sp. GCM10028922 TaxID=3273428 RepID=UPI00360CB781
MTGIPGFWAVIPAGGSGTRLWPISRRSSPKFLHDLTGSGQSLLRATWDRLEPLVGERILVVTGVAHEEAVRRQLPMLGYDAVVGEPSPRDSMPAIGLAAAILERRDPEAVLGSFAADHVITRPDNFHRAVGEAVVLARRGELVTIGIEPTGPSTAFGYIRLGEALGVEGAESAHRVDEFVEKPDAETATRYLESGLYRWNAGMFVVGATTLLELLAENHAEMVDHLRTIAADPRRMRDLWPSLHKIAIDHAVAEPAAAAGRVAVVPAALGWDDVGDFAALTKLVPESAELPGITAIGPVDDIISIDSTATVSSGGRLVALIGVDDLVVIDTQDALLITRPGRAQDVKKVVEALTAQGRTELI